MKKVFLDTNILVDLIADRKPFSKYAIDIFTLAENQTLTLFTSSHSIATTHYLLKKYVEEDKLRAILIDLLDLVRIIPVDLNVLQKSLKSNHKDFEDAIQVCCASATEQMEYIITRNLKDFRQSEIPAISPDEFCRQI